VISTLASFLNPIFKNLINYQKIPKMHEKLKHAKEQKSKK